MKTTTWKELAEAIAQMPENLKNDRVMILLEDSENLIHMNTLDFVRNDIFINKEYQDDRGPLEDLKILHGEDFNINDYEMCTKGGTHFLMNNDGL